MAQSKEQVAAYKQAYYAANKETIAAKKKVYRTKNREQRAAYDKSYYAANKRRKTENARRVPRGKGSSLYSRYRISLDEYNKMLGSQNAVCAICGHGETIRNKRLGTVNALAVDHCHSTGLVRKLLCSGCNTSLGRFKDSPELLEAAAQYLRNHSTQKKAA